MKKIIVLIISIPAIAVLILAINFYKVKQRADFLKNEMQYEYEKVQSQLISFEYNNQCTMNSLYYKFPQCDTFDLDSTLFLRMNNVCLDCFIDVFDIIKSLADRYSWEIVITAYPKDDTWLYNNLKYVGYEDFRKTYFCNDIKLPVDSTGLPYIFTISERNNIILNVFLINKDYRQEISSYFSMLQRWRSYASLK